MIDIKELRRLAEADIAQGDEWPTHEEFAEDNYIETACSYLAAASPSAILSLLDKIDAQEKEIAELRKDAERLDYVLCNGRPLKHEFMYRYQCKGTMNWYDDPRDAIDAAMEADKWIVPDTSTQEVG